MNERRKQRLTYIDWMRGLACLLMFQTHCYDSWLSDAARSTKFFNWSQLGGTLPAPLFLFLAGVFFALATDKLRQRGVAAHRIARSTPRRGGGGFGRGGLFPWSAFAFAGLAVGFVLLTDWARRREAAAAALAGVGGVTMAALGWWLDAQPRQVYAVYDFWHTSPNFFLIRIGLLMGILFASYAWCRWGAGQWGFSPVIQLGQTSLLVYWVHIEFVYGRFSILPKRAMSIPAATLGLLGICLAMLLLSIARTRLKGRGAEVWGWLRLPA